MEEVIDFLHTAFGKRHVHVIDIPAGSGEFAQYLESMGHDVVRADICGRDGFVHTNMEKPLPFSTGEFDLVTCMEGIEHVLNPSLLLGELVRMTKPGGLIVISMPNICNLWSRLTFLLTGTFYQFSPSSLRQTRGQSIDRSHVSPMTPLHLIYLMGHYGAQFQEWRIDRIKKKILWPLYALLCPFLKLCTHICTRKIVPGTYPGLDKPNQLLGGYKLAFGRSQIMIFQHTSIKK